MENIAFDKQNLILTFLLILSPLCWVDGHALPCTGLLILIEL